MCISVIELAFSALRIDPATVSSQLLPPASYLSDTQVASSCLGLHKEASSVLSVLFAQYPQHRQGILIELLSLLSQVLNHCIPCLYYINIIIIFILYIY